jgi:imidazolonepropionase-like amidohydrolase
MKKQLVKSKLLIESPSAKPIQNGAILIDGNHIAAVGHRSDFREDASIQIIDCSDQVLMPGLIDAHNHLSLDGSLEDYLQKMADPIPALTIRATKNLCEDLMSGITTIRCLGDKDFLDMECRKAVNSGYIQGPRIITSGKGIRSSAGHGYVGYPFDGIEAVRMAVRDNISNNADLIKFYVTGTLPGIDGIPCFFSREEIEVIMQEAQRMGKKTAVHCIGGIGLKWCIEIGVDTIEHGFFLTDDEIEMIKQSKTWLVLTPSFYMSDVRVRALPDPLIEPHLKAKSATVASMRAAIKAGVQFAVGTDGMHGKGALARETEYLVELGASEQTALRAATCNAAEVCGISHITGTLEPGKEADIVGIQENPLKNIKALKDIRTVIYRGNLVLKL